MRDLIYLCECSFGLHIKQGVFSSQPCILQPISLLVCCQLLRWQSLRLFSNVALTLRHWPKNTSATTLHGIKNAFRTSNAPTPIYRMSTTTGGRSSELTSETWESVHNRPAEPSRFSSGAAAFCQQPRTQRSLKRSPIKTRSFYTCSHAPSILAQCTYIYSIYSTCPSNASFEVSNPHLETRSFSWSQTSLYESDSECFPSHTWAVTYVIAPKSRSMPIEEKYHRTHV
jgi:hypothetical protein